MPSRNKPQLGNGNIQSDNKKLVASAWFNSIKRENAEIAMPIIVRLHKMMLEHNITVSVRLSDTNHSDSYTDHRLVANFNLFPNQLAEEDDVKVEEDKFDANRFNA